MPKQVKLVVLAFLCTAELGSNASRVFFFISTLQHGTKNTRLDCGIVSSSPSPTSSTFPHQLKPPTPSSASVPPVSLTSTVDIVGKRLREEQLQTRVKAAQAFIEKTLGVVLPSSDLHESLKDGVILCKYVFFLPFHVCASYLNHHPRFMCVCCVCLVLSFFIRFVYFVVCVCACAPRTLCLTGPHGVIFFCLLPLSLSLGWPIDFDPTLCNRSASRTCRSSR